MISTTSVLKSLIDENLELRSLWNKEIINLSALAKQLKPEVEKRLSLNVELSSLVVSLNRLSKSWKAENQIPKIEIKSIQIIKNIVTLVYRRNPEVVNTIMRIKDAILELDDVYIAHEIARSQIVFTTELPNLKSFQKSIDLIEKYCKSKSINLIAVCFDLNIQEKFDKSGNSVNYIHYAILHKLAQSNIPVIRMKSCQNQFEFLIQEKYLDQVYRFWKVND